MPSLIDNYILERKVGEGTSGEVFKGKEKCKPYRPVAVKFIPKKSLSSAGRDNLLNEISSLKKLKYQFIIQMMDFSWNDTHVYIVLEYANAGDLSGFIKKRKVLSESLARIFCQQLCSALLFMRTHNISHMDLKPSNLLLHKFSPNRNPVLKVADFGFADHLEGENDLGVRGSPLYMAPEIVLTKSYSPKVDIWSVGVILFEALFGRAPFSSSTLEELIQKIKEDKAVSLPGDISLSPECRSFLSSCLQRNPEQRMGFKELKDDPFLNLELSIPHPHSEEKMVENERLGAVAESTGDLKQSINNYEKAAEYARTLYYYAEDESLRGKYKSFLRGYQTKLSNLTRDQLPSREVSRQQVVNNSLPNYAELYHLAKITPGMEGGLEICIAARNYQLQGDIEQAVDRYTAGLGVLVPLLQKEPKGTRRDLLHEAVKCWLQQAEALKDTLQIQQNTLQKMEGYSEQERCSIQ